MEEHVGQLWHRLVTRAASTHYPREAVTLDDIAPAVALLFRALGGDAGARVEAARATTHGARRPWLARMAGTDVLVPLAWRDPESVRLPARVDVFPTRTLNHDLYLWLAALAAQDDGRGGPWFARQQRLTLAVLQRFPGLSARYRRLVAAQLALRPDPARLRRDEAAQERALQLALRVPGSVTAWPSARRPPRPVYLWLHPAPPVIAPAAGAAADGAPDANTADHKRKEKAAARQAAERTEAPVREGGLLLYRFESLFSWTEYTRVHRGVDDDDNEAAARAAADLEKLSVARDERPTAARLRLDLDLPAAEQDETPLGDGVTLPEWDYRRRTLRPDHCRVIPMQAGHASPCALPAHLRGPAARLRRQFQALAPARTWLRAQPDGMDADLDAYVRFVAERGGAKAVAAPGLYKDLRDGERDLACLLLADLSLSTDAWVDDDARIIDIIRDSLFLFGESLAATHDRFAIYGFSSRRREHVRVHLLKGFDETYGATVRGRVRAIKPGYYTRMGAAIRYATTLLAQQPARRRLLLLLTDGKPNDLDIYEGRYGAEDTRVALREARRQGIQAFCVTIDTGAPAYLPYLFGQAMFTVIRSPADLPARLPLLYAHLTR
jgi:nitric oxide reductase NorD protein